MGDANHPYITKLFATFKNDVYLYMLLEVSLGGELPPPLPSATA